MNLDQWLYVPKGGSDPRKQPWLPRAEPGSRMGKGGRAAAEAAAEAANAAKAAAAVAPVQPSLPPPAVVRRQPRVLVFTMDSLTEYVRRAAAGGPAGEIAVRTGLEAELRALGVEVVTAASDGEFAAHTATALAADGFDAYVLDPWTFVAPSECSGGS
jgi:DNA-binding NarL/FixJ family response regulator